MEIDMKRVITPEMVKTLKCKSSKLIKQDPYVGDDGIYVPCEEYVPNGYISAYRCVLTKEMFVEAYNKWIKEW